MTQRITKIDRATLIPLKRPIVTQGDDGRRYAMSPDLVKSYLRR